MGPRSGLRGRGAELTCEVVGKEDHATHADGLVGDIYSLATTATELHTRGSEVTNGPPKGDVSIRSFGVTVRLGIGDGMGEGERE